MNSKPKPTFRRKFEKNALLDITDEVRTELDIQHGDVFVAQVQPDDGTIRLVRVQDPLDFLGIEAIAEDEDGLTISLDEAAKELEIGIDRSETGCK